MPLRLWWGAGVLLAVMAVMGYVSQFVDWFDRLTTGQQGLFILLAGFAVPTAWWLLRQVGVFLVAILRPQRGPEVMLLAPSMPLTVRWVPREQLGMNWWIEGRGPTEANRGDVTFKLKNLGPQPVTDIVMDWTIRSKQPIEDVFLGAKGFQAYNASVSDGFFHLSIPPVPGTAHGIGVPARDSRQLEIAFLRPTPNSDDAQPVVWPAALDHSFLFRVIAADVPQFTGGYFEHGPEIDVSIRYRDASGIYKRDYRITSQVSRFADNASGIVCGPDIQSAHAWTNNFRGRVTFAVTRT